MEDQLIPFGKYKGQPVEVLAQDKPYLDWLQGQAWFRERYGNINTLIINNFAAPSETPDHNNLQAIFTDGEFRMSFIKHVHSISEGPFGKRDFLSIDDTVVEFEKEGIDVVIWVEFCDQANAYFNVGVELKPELSDDYPAVFRQMKTNKSNHLLIRKYTGKGATLEQVRLIFRSAAIKIIILSEITS